MKPILFDFPKSSSSFRVRIAAAVKEIPLELHLVDFRKDAQRSDEYLAVNPAGLVPALKHDELIIAQSGAIIRYLDRLSPDNVLFPATDPLATQVEELTGAIACDIHPLNNLRVLEYLRAQFDKDQDAVSEWYRHWISKGFEGLEKRIAATSGKYCCGDQLTAVDVYLAPQMFNARRYDTPLERFPTLVRIDNELRLLETFQSAAPD